MCTVPAEDEATIAWTRGLWHAMEPFASGGVYVNYLGEERDEGAERVRAAYDPEKYEPLARLQRQYDPEDRFRIYQNTPPCWMAQLRRTFAGSDGCLRTRATHTRSRSLPCTPP